MLIRAGILSIGTLDEDAIAAVTNVLRSRISGLHIVLTQAVGSQRHWIADTLMRWCDEEELDLLVTLGGTLPAAGPSPEEITPDATRDVLERNLPGLPESMRARAAQETRLALMDRGTAGIRGRSLILNLPEGTATPLLFLDGIVDVLPALLLHLTQQPDAPRPEDELVIVDEDEVVQETEGEMQEEGSQLSGLNEEEFEAFRQRRRR